MDDDELLARLRAGDPARTDHPADSWIEDLVEATMKTESTDSMDADSTTRETRARSRWLLPAAAAAVVAALAAGGFALAGDDSGGDDSGGTDDEQTTLALLMPASDSMQMCMQFSPEALRPVDVAFEGTATEVAGDQVTLDVDTWFKGGDADAVELTSQTEVGILLEGGVEFVEGERYLVAASGGTVNSCGFSGLWSADMAAAYAEAFGG